AAPVRRFGVAQQAVLIASDVEDHDHVTPAHVDQPVAPVALLAGQVEDIGPDDGEMGGRVAGDRIGETSAEEKDASLPVDEKPDDFGKLALGDMAEGRADVFERRLERLRYCAAAELRLA